MQKNSNTVGIVIAIILIVLIVIFIAWIVGLSEPKCAIIGCENKTTGSGNFCHLHDMSDRYYGNPDYNDVYEESKERQKAAGSSNSNYSSSSDSSSSSSNSSSYSSKSYSNKSSSSGYSSGRYDDGYDDVYSDGEPDWDRYDEDDDYAMGADDAMDEYDEYGEDW